MPGIDIFKISLIAFMFCALGDEGMIFNRYQKLIEKLPEWLFFPLGGCYLCFTGQVCFWYFLVNNFTDYIFIDHLFFTSAGIFLSAIYHRIYYFMR